MLRVPLLLVLVLGLPGCLGGPWEDREEQTSVRYWELVTTLEWTGDGEPVLLEQGPHCSGLVRHDDRLTLLRDPDDPRPDGHALGRTWVGDVPDGGHHGSGYDGWLHDGTALRTVGGGILFNITWEGDVPVLDGEPRADGWNRTTHYEEAGWAVDETVTLHDHGTLPLTVRTEDEVICE